MSTTSSTDAPAAAKPRGVPVLEARGVSVRFGGVAALTDVSIQVEPGEIVGLIGPNGAGKTTLFDAISGIRTPTSGSIVLNGVDVTSRSATWRSRNGMRRTFQRQQTFGWLSVEENVLTALEWHGGGGGLLADLVALPSRRRREHERRLRSREVMETCGITDVKDEPAGKLPIGRARMVELARAIVDRPTVLLLDEPTSGLEENETHNLGQTVRRVRDDEGCSVVLVEHDVAFVMAMCDRIVVLNLGKVIATGTPDEVRSDPAVRAAYLG